MLAVNNWGKVRQLLTPEKTKEVVKDKQCNYSALFG